MVGRDYNESRNTVVYRIDEVLWNILVSVMIWQCPASQGMKLTCNCKVNDQGMSDVLFMWQDQVRDENEERAQDGQHASHGVQRRLDMIWSLISRHHDGDCLPRVSLKAQIVERTYLCFNTHGLCAWVCLYQLSVASAPTDNARGVRWPATRV